MDEGKYKTAITTLFSLLINAACLADVLFHLNRRDIDVILDMDFRILQAVIVLITFGSSVILFNRKKEIAGFIFATLPAFGLGVINVLESGWYTGLLFVFFFSIPLMFWNLEILRKNRKILIGAFASASMTFFIQLQSG